MRVIRIGLCPLLQKFFLSKIFCPVYVTIWLVRIWTYKNTNKKEHTFPWRRKNVRKRTKADKKRILRKSILTTTFFCYQAEKALKNIQLKNSEMNLYNFTFVLKHSF